MFDLSGQVALITGGSRGIGRATAILLAQAGACPVINYQHNEGAAREALGVVEQFGTQGRIFAADVARKDQVDEMIAYTVREFGRLDILVNNAGIWKYGAIDQLTEEQLEGMLAVNLKGVFYASSAAVKQMKKQRTGSIIHISSTAGQRGEAFHSHYAASKGAIISLTKSLAVELASFNIRVNCVAPGWVETDMTYQSLNSPEREEILRAIPMGRVGKPEEIAGCVLFLASRHAAFITGEILNVNGGAVLCG